jgi:hypothetical protein
MKRFQTLIINSSKRFLSTNQKIVKNTRKEDVIRDQSAIKSGASQGSSDKLAKTDVDTTKTDYIHPQSHLMHESHPTSVKTGFSSNVADFTSVNEPETHNIFENKSKDKTFYKTSKDINLHNNIEKNVEEGKKEK